MDYEEEILEREQDAREEGKKKVQYMEFTI